MQVFRVEKQKYISTILEGIPGKEFSFRWNTKGHPIIYASKSRSLALHEKCGNMSKPFYGLPKIYKLAVIELPEINFRTIIPESLPDNWNSIDEYQPYTQKLGDEFTLSDELGLLVPSSIIQGEYNILINPSQAIKLELIVNTEKIDDRIIDLRI